MKNSIYIALWGGFAACPLLAAPVVLIDEDFTSGSASGLTWTSSAAGISNGQEWVWSSPPDDCVPTQTEMWTGTGGASARGLFTTYDHDNNIATPNINIPGGFEVMSGFTQTAPGDPDGGLPDSLRATVTVVLPANLDDTEDGLLTFFTENRINGGLGGNDPQYSVHNVTDDREIIPLTAPSQPTGAWNFQSAALDFIPDDAGDTIEIRFQDSITSGGAGGARGLQIADVALVVEDTTADASVYWDGSTSGGSNGVDQIWDTTTANWNDADDFSGSLDAWAGGTAVLGGTAGTITLGEPITVESLIANTFGYEITGDTLTFSGATPSLEVNDDLTLSSALGGSATIARTGAGLLSLTGSGAGFTGTIDNQAGLLSLISNDWSGAGFDASVGSLFIDAPGTVDIGSLEIGVGLVDVLSGTVLDLSGGTLQFTPGQAGLISGDGSLTSSSGTLTVNGGLTDNGGLNTSNQRIEVVIADSGGPVALEKNFNNQLRLSRTNTFSGGTTINAGRIQPEADGAFGTGGVTVNDGGQVFLVSNQATDVTINGNGAVEGAGTLGAIRFNNTTLTGNLTVASASRITGYNNNQNGTIDGDLLGTGDLEVGIADRPLSANTISLLGSGAGFTGTLTVSRGRFNTGAALGGNVVVGDNGTLGAEGSIAGDLTLGDTGGATLVIDPNNPPSCDNLVLNGTTSVVFSGPPTPGAPVVLASYATSVTDDGTPSDLSDNLDFPGTGYRMSTFSDNVGAMTVELDLGAVVNTWNGSGDAVWEVGGASTNWTNATDTLFYNGDSALFDDSAASFSVSVDATNGDLAPSSVSFVNNLPNHYLISGDAIGGPGALTKSGDGVVTLENDWTMAGGATVNGGTLRIGNGGPDGAFSGSIELNAPGTLDFFRSSGGPLGALTGDGSLLIRSTGVILEGSYDFTGSTAGFTGDVTIDDARLRIDTADFGDITTPVHVLPGGQGYLQSGTHDLDFLVNGIGWTESAGQLGAVRFENGAVLEGDITLESDSRLTAWTGGTGGRMTGQITGGFDLEKTGSARLTLDPPALNTYGSTTVSSGALVAGSLGAFAFSSGPLTVNGGSLQMNGWDFAFDQLAGSGGTVGNYNDNFDVVLTVGANDASTSYDGTIIDGGLGLLSLVKVGDGTLVLNGANTYTGPTTVSAGTLGGSGSLTSDVTVAAGAGLAPGASAGVLAIDGDLDLSAPAGGAGLLEFELDAIGASDQITVTGTTEIGSGLLGFADFSFSDLGGLENGTYTLISSGTLNGTLNGADLTGPIGAASGTLQINAGDIELVVTGASTPFESWVAGAFANGTLDPADQDPTDDPDGDGIDNLGEFGFDGDPTDATNSGKVYLVIADGDDVDGDTELLLTAAIRTGGTFGASGSPLVSADVDGLTYTIGGSLDLTGFTTQVNLEGAAIPPAGGLPALSSPDWEYRSFNLEGSDGVPGRGFMRAGVEETP